MSSKSKHFKSKKEKKLINLIKNPDTEDEESEHELSYYVNDRVQLMKEILKVIRPKKIKAMAPDCLKDMEIEEVNSLLLEELLGISNKRLKYIFEGKNLEEESSSSEDDQKPVDIISLDDISEDELILIDSDEDTVVKGRTKHKHKIKEENFKRKKVKKEKQEKTKITEKSKDSNKNRTKEDTGNDKLMSVLELLELQARARAIRSQLALENSKKPSEKEEEGKLHDAIEEDEDDAVIIQSPKNEEIIITSSESEIEDNVVKYENGENSVGNENIETSKTQLISQNMQNNDQDIHNEKIISDVTGNITSIPLPNEESIYNVCNSTKGETSERSALAVSFTSSSLTADKKSDIIVKGDKQQGTYESLENPSNEQLETTSNDFKSHVCKDEEIVKGHNLSSGKDVDLKKKRLKDFKNKIKSYKNELCTEGKIQIMENITIKKPVQLPKRTGEALQDGDGLIINVDQDEMDCIICD